ncbi:MAG TPA: hypothetical protein VFL82_00235 [Thermomicrobiales bacterium]|nr:hypothetical protein [Thermomicrobiales bacterium]
MRRFAVAGLIVAGLILGIPALARPSGASTTNQASEGRVDIGEATPTPCATPGGRHMDPGFAVSLPPGQPGDPGFVIKFPPGASVDPGFSPSACGRVYPSGAP